MKRPILFALIFAVVAAFFAYMYMSDLETKYKTMSEPVKTVISVQRIPQGTVIQSNMVAEKYIPKEYAQPKVFQNMKELFTENGAAVYISLNTIEENEQILSTKISKTNEDAGISNLIPDGKKALSVNFDLDAANILTPGTRIDIFSIVGYVDTNKELQESVFAAAQNILVLAVGNSCIGSAKKQDDDLGNLSVITMAVSVEEAQRILLAGEKGSLKYVIRPSGDIEIEDIKPLKLSSMIKDLSKTALPNRIKNPKLTNQKEMLDIISKYASVSK
jgi:pilus assembly protein CpaB